MDSRHKRLVPATAALAERLARTLSPDHRREIAATCGGDAGDALRHSLACSLEAYALLDERGEPVFLMGVEEASPFTRGAMVWMLARADIARHAPAALRSVRWGLVRAFAVSGADWLEQFIPAWYRTGLWFAERLGFCTVPGGGRDRSGGALRRVVLYKESIRKEHSDGSVDERHERRFDNHGRGTKLPERPKQ